MSMGSDDARSSGAGYGNISVLVPQVGARTISRQSYLEPVARFVMDASRPGYRQKYGKQSGDDTVIAGQILNGTIVSEANDTITVTPFGGGADVTVAKPPHLRGATSTRPGNSETQEIFPAYTPSGLIWYTESDNTGVGGVTLIDVNVDARTWGEPPPGGFGP